MSTATRVLDDLAKSYAVPTQEAPDLKSREWTELSRLCLGSMHSGSKRAGATCLRSAGKVAYSLGWHGKPEGCRDTTPLGKQRRASDTNSQTSLLSR